MENKKLLISQNVEMSLTENIIHISNQVDTRQLSKTLYPLHEIIFIIIFGNMVLGTNVYNFLIHAEQNLNFLRNYFPYENGVPSKNTIYRTLQLIKPQIFTIFIELYETEF